MFSLVVLLFSCCVIAYSMEIVPMTEWSERDTLREEVLSTPVGMVVIQHTATQECDTDEECVALLKGIQSYHMRIGFTDIGYSFMIAPSGKVYEGAGWQKVGAHTRFFNGKSLGIAFIGNFQGQLPSPEALQAAKDLFDYGVEKQYLSEDYKLLGHRQLSMTLSPGDALYEEIQQWPHWTDNKSQ